MGLRKVVDHFQSSQIWKQKFIDLPPS